MVAIMKGERPPKEKGRATLSVRSPLVTSLLAGLGIERDHIEELHAFGNRLVRDRNEWDIARRRRGLFGTRRNFTKRDAERAWSEAFGNGGAA